MLDTAMPTVRTVMSLMSCDHTVGKPAAKLGRRGDAGHEPPSP